jgi:hypothetical protein
MLRATLSPCGAPTPRHCGIGLWAAVNECKAIVIHVIANSLQSLFYYFAPLHSPFKMCVLLTLLLYLLVCFHSHRATLQAAEPLGFKQTNTLKNASILLVTHDRLAAKAAAAAYKWVSCDPPC